MRRALGPVDLSGKIKRVTGDGKEQKVKLLSTVKRRMNTRHQQFYSVLLFVENRKRLAVFIGSLSQAVSSGVIQENVDRYMFCPSLVMHIQARKTPPSLHLMTSCLHRAQLVIIPNESRPDIRTVFNREILSSRGSDGEKTLNEDSIQAEKSGRSTEKFQV
ncbi:hypothetical protein DPX16_7124 [Anabarilius grahami]|uniref:Uncharacterized protein n=1 Tax=Anabarilius grahami TaxID=495550 RepID=A0A3N0XY43_ANAGA|nr:hypothetical protein DPX16_7124 [Anabarilius grahami]